MNKIRILGIDPGSRLLGFGCIEKNGNQIKVLHHGTIHLFHAEYKKLPVDETTPSRLKDIYLELSKIIVEYRPQAIAVEKVFFAKNAVSALKLGQARGVVLLSGAMHDLEVYEYSATEVKSIVTGHGRSDKEQVAKMLQMLLGKQKFDTVDASDALALAVTHAMNLGPSANRMLPANSGGGKSKHSLKDIFTAKIAKKS